MCSNIEVQILVRKSYRFIKESIVRNKSRSRNIILGHSVKALVNFMWWFLPLIWFSCAFIESTLLSNMLLEQGYAIEGLKASLRNCLWSIRGSYQIISSFPRKNVKWHSTSVAWSYTNTTHHRFGIIPNNDLITVLRLLPNYERFR